MRKYSSVIVGTILFLASGCSTYKENIMFKTGGVTPSKVKAAADQTLIMSTIRKFDYLIIDVFLDNGEKLIDPNPELSNGKDATTSESTVKYLVNVDGNTALPLVGEIKLEGLTLQQAGQRLTTEYEIFYKAPFVTVKFNNKRVIVLGSSGGGGQVIPLENENTSLIEVIALAKGINNDARANNIRVIRGNDVYVIDLSTIEGYREGNMIIESGDIVYVEPVRRPLTESSRANAFILSAISSIVVLITLLTR